ncbi:MAG: hypothetical protein AAFU85_26500 [Planctomycetota bacterium]
MKVDVEALRKALHAEVEPMEDSGGKDGPQIFRFRDSVLKFELWVHLSQGSVFLAADPSEPIQACPLLEYGFVCSEIEVGMNAYGDSAGDAIRFFQHRRSEGGIRLTMTPRGNDRWYLWAAACDPSLESPEQMRPVTGPATDECSNPPSQNRQTWGHL